MSWHRIAIIWTKADPIHWRIYAMLGGDELNDADWPSITSLEMNILQNSQFLKTILWTINCSYKSEKWDIFVQWLQNNYTAWPWDVKLDKWKYPIHNMPRQTTLHQLYCLTLRCYHIEAETKWPTFSRRHFQMHFLQWKYLNFEYNLTEVCSWGSNQQ